MQNHLTEWIGKEQELEDGASDDDGFSTSRSQSRSRSRSRDPDGHLPLPEQVAHLLSAADSVRHLPEPSRSVRLGLNLMDMTRSCPDVMVCAEELGWSRGTFSRPNAAARLEDQVVALLASTAPDRSSSRGNIT
eukprot:13963463-Heterocapsa_arctica.AAC.1